MDAIQSCHTARAFSLMALISHPICIISYHTYVLSTDNITLYNVLFYNILYHTMPCHSIETEKNIHFIVFFYSILHYDDRRIYQCSFAITLKYNQSCFRYLIPLSWRLENIEIFFLVARHWTKFYCLGKKSNGLFVCLFFYSILASYDGGACQFLHSKTFKLNYLLFRFNFPRDWKSRNFLQIPRRSI